MKVSWGSLSSFFGKDSHSHCAALLSLSLYLTQDFRSETKRLMVNKSLGETLLHRSARNNRMVSRVSRTN